MFDKVSLITSDKDEIFSSIIDHLSEYGLMIKTVDRNRPWGGFLVIENVDKFIEIFFSDYNLDNESNDRYFYVGHSPNINFCPLNGQKNRNLSPKILVIAPNQHLSWQYHFRRSEIWKVVKGSVAVITSDTDELREPKYPKEGDIITIAEKERHRLVGLNSWAIVAELWQHTDVSKPSDENDIVRLQDNYGRVINSL